MDTDANEKTVYAARYTRQSNHLWTWWRDGRITCDGKLITVRSFFDRDLFAEIICDHEGPQNVEYWPQHRVETKTYGSGAKHLVVVFWWLQHIADYATSKRVLAEVPHVIERLREQRLRERRLR